VAANGNLCQENVIKSFQPQINTDETQMKPLVSLVCGNLCQSVARQIPKSSVLGETVRDFSTSLEMTTRII
jgi:hypothetical protein